MAARRGVRRRVVARRRSAAVVLGRRARPFRRRRRAARPRFDRLRRRDDRDDEDRRDADGRAYQSRSIRFPIAPAQLSRDRGGDDDPQGRRRSSPRSSRRAACSRRGNGDDPAGIVTLRLGQVYTAIGDPNADGACDATLLEAAGDADLGSAPSRWRSAARCHSPTSAEVPARRRRRVRPRGGGAGDGVSR